MGWEMYWSAWSSICSPRSLSDSLAGIWMVLVMTCPLMATAAYFVFGLARFTALRTASPAASTSMIILSVIALDGIGSAAKLSTVYPLPFLASSMSFTEEVLISMPTSGGDDGLNSTSCNLFKSFGRPKIGPYGTHPKILSHSFNIYQQMIKSNKYFAISPLQETGVFQGLSTALGTP